ncbi:MAG: hypothetical protein LQ350_001935 [Teloschistes chrysophthalmus]|nr:MAG: hypothetical protein LQ350_001935 [Niorma chrysophthalma]
MASMNLVGERSSRASKGGNLLQRFENRKIVPPSNQLDVPLPVPEGGEGWKCVQRGKPSNAGKVFSQNSERNRQPIRPFGGPPSAAAQARRQAQDPPRGKGGSYYKQSCLPVEERRQSLVEQEAYQGSVFKKNFFRPGMIVRGILHEQDHIATSRGSNITISERNHTDSRYGPICTKFRKMIILTLHHDNYTAIPLFTHNGQGLAFKPNPEEFVSSRDHRAREQSPPQSKHEPLDTEIMDKGIDLIDVKSTAHFTYSLSRRYELPVVHEGELKKNSLNRLIDLFHMYSSPKKVRDRDGKIC